MAFRRPRSPASIGIDPKTLRKHYRQELDHGHIKANAKVAENLYRKATGDGPRSGHRRDLLAEDPSPLEGDHASTRSPTTSPIRSAALMQRIAEQGPQASMIQD